MKKFILLIIVLCLFIPTLGFTKNKSSRKEEANIVEQQQRIYSKVHPIPFFEYSIPRDVYIQIYEVVTTRAYLTYTVIESMVGKTFYHGPSIGYAIPADTSLTNPDIYVYDGGTVEQPEPNGLFSSKNTDGTWVLFLQDDGTITPVYTEHKVTTFPFAVKKVDDIWVRADSKPVDFTIDIE